MKTIKVKVTLHDFSEDITEILPINVPDGLSEEEENKLIKEKVEDFKFNYGY